MKSSMAQVGKSVPQFLVFADDLTGALEAGAAFAQHGTRATVSLRLDVATTDTPVLVIDTETRHLTAELAKKYVQKAMASLGIRKQTAPLHIYKKTDSTLRGHIRAELSALCDYDSVLYIPAHPRAGRTLKNGCIHVEGVPLNETWFANDPRHPIRYSNVDDLVCGEPRIEVSHANTHEELLALARQWLLDGGVAAGPGGFLQALSEVVRCGTHLPLPACRRVAVISGSLNARSREQIARAAKLFSEQTWCVFESPQEKVTDPAVFATSFGREAWMRAQRFEADTMIVFGGDTAYSLLHAMNVAEVESLGELFPGIPISKLPNGLTLITKAGGFGEPDLLEQIHQKISHTNVTDN
jgi:D-threonate/D-erythronate kinase